MKINNPTYLDPRNLKIGDKLRVKKKAYRVNNPNDPGNSIYVNTEKEANDIEPRGTRLPYVNVGDVYDVVGFEANPSKPPTPRIFLLCYELGDDIGPATALKLINFGVFEYVK
jgi:hypothetical protein